LKITINQLVRVIIILLLIPYQLKAQNNSIKKMVDWSYFQPDNNTVKYSLNLEFPRYLPEKFTDLPLIHLKIPVQSAQILVHVKPLQTQITKQFNSQQTAKIEQNIWFDYQVVEEQKKLWLMVNILPLFKSSNDVYQLLEYEIILGSKAANFQAQKTNNLKLSLASNSVLATGNWYKIGLKNEGLYKLDYNFLRNLGIAVDQLNPRFIKIFGNGGRALAQENNAARQDDLFENAIKVIGEEDGKFDPQDYVLFYAEGNVHWEFNAQTQKFIHHRNHYSDSSFYFINIEGNNGKRIQKQSYLNQNPNYNTSSYTDVQLHERENYTAIMENLKSGREWYGEDFEFNNNQNFSFNLDGIKITDSVYIEADMAIRASQNSTAELRINNQTIATLNATAVPLSFDTDYATPAHQSFSFLPSSVNFSVSINYNKPNSLANAWLNYIRLSCTKDLKTSNWLRFRDISSTGLNKITQFNFSGNLTGKEIWDITNPLAPIAIDNSLNSFIYPTTNLKEFLLFDVQSAQEPKFIKKVANQNLHALAPNDMIIVSPPEFLSEAKRLADFRLAEQNIRSHIVTPEQIYNEFSSGARDATAIRDFMRMLYKKASTNNLPKHLLLFGSGSFDNRNIRFNNHNFIVTYQSRNSLSPTQSYTSDDYFALLDDDEGDFPENFVDPAGLLDINVGRLPVATLKEARDLVDKLIYYTQITQLGSWRNQTAILADDEDANVHLNQAEANANILIQQKPDFNIHKIYFDAYKQESTASGSRYPDVRKAIDNILNNGVMLINYTGHGGEGGLAAERILTVDDINNWNNFHLPIIFTATCSFSRWDDPLVRSAGELLLKREKHGAVALFTTTRIVFASYNFDLNQSFLIALCQAAAQNRKISFGEVFRLAKNNNIGGLNINSRNFTLLGDPSTLFPIPYNKVNTLSVNEKSISNLDTLKALQKVKITGQVVAPNQAVLNAFNGTIYPVIYDKATSVTTLGQDPGLFGSIPQVFKTQTNIIYKGKASVRNGQFSFEFIVPKDINLQYGEGKISYYAENQQIDAAGSLNNIIIGGIDNGVTTDNEGPIIELFLNDEKFVSGGITNSSPFLLVNLNDESGINTTGIGIGHDIVATLSYNNQNTSIILNDWYQAKTDSYQSGSIKYLLENLKPGIYSLKLKAWDTFNNSSEQIIDFEVKNSDKLEIAHVLNYPNPFTTKTNFQFEHNHPNEDLDVQVNIYTIAGKLIKTINQTIISTGNRVDGIFWDAKDNFGDKIGRGVYIYELKVRSNLTGETAKKTEKIVIL
jgi:hypothetical protein